MADVRKNQKSLSSQEWNALIQAINATHGVNAQAPAYRDFLALHVQAMSMSGMAWGVHYMGPGTSGRNFLAWHRRFLRELELRLQQVTQGLALPYWDWVQDRSIPSALDDPGLLQSWSVSRSWDPSFLPSAAAVDAVVADKKFGPFQLALEHQHDFVHRAVGGTMDSPSSPADPLFWLHHANIDRIWDQWQQSHKMEKPSNPNEVMQKPPIIGVKVSTQLDITSLGYAYA
jgi:tyrosinase